MTSHPPSLLSRIACAPSLIRHFSLWSWGTEAQARLSSERGSPPAVIALRQMKDGTPSPAGCSRPAMKLFNTWRVVEVADDSTVPSCRSALWSLCPGWQQQPPACCHINLYQVLWIASVRQLCPLPAEERSTVSRKRKLVYRWVLNDGSMLDLLVPSHLLSFLFTLRWELLP